MAQQVVVIEPDYFSVEVTAPQTVTISNTGPQGATGPEGGTSTLTTKGDILGRSATAVARIPVGTDGQMLTADSTNPLGVAWTTPNPGDITGVTVSAPITGGGTSGTVNIGISTGSGLTTSAGSLVVDSTLVPFLASANVFTNTQQVTIPSAATRGLIVRAATSQTANLQEWHNSSGTILARVAADGSLITADGQLSYLSTNTNYVATLNVQTAATTYAGVVIRGRASQTADLQQWQNSAGSVLASISSAGNFVGVVGRFGNSANIGAIVNVNTVATGNVGIAVRGVASQTANLQEWQDSTGTILNRIDSAGRLTTWTSFSESITGRSINLANSSGGNVGITLNPNSVTADGSVFGVIAFNGATADLGSAPTTQIKMWRSSGAAAGTMAFQVRGTDGVLYDRLTIANGVPAIFTPQSAGSAVLVSRGAASQTANLQEWQNSSGGIVASIGSGGGFLAATVATNTSYATLVEENSGGRIRLTKMTAAATNPGTDLIKIYVRDGTNAGTLKLVVRAGTAGAETTILDNIPQ